MDVQVCCFLTVCNVSGRLDGATVSIQEAAGPHRTKNIESVMHVACAADTGIGLSETFKLRSIDKLSMHYLHSTTSGSSLRIWF